MRLKRYEDINWEFLWQQAIKEKSWPAKNAADWNERAAAFTRRTEQSPYTETFLSLLNAQPSWSVLDVGSGPGTLALPLAKRVNTVTCIDFSSAMLQILTERAKQMALDNISTHALSWSDDWQAHGITRHDVAIASRSLSVLDLGDALRRLNAFAIHKVVVTDRVGPGPFDPDAFAAVGRPLRLGPDYIFTVNLLYRMGCLAKVDFIRLEAQPRYRSFDEVVCRYLWMFRELNDAETKRLHRYIHSIADLHEDGSVSLHGRHVPTWAFISWHPDCPSL